MMNQIEKAYWDRYIKPQLEYFSEKITYRVEPIPEDTRDLEELITMLDASLKRFKDLSKGLKDIQAEEKRRQELLKLLELK